MLKWILCLFIMPQHDMIFSSTSRASPQFRAIAFAMTSITTKSLQVTKKRTNSRNSRWLSTTASPDVDENNLHNSVDARKSNTESTTSLLRGGSSTDADDVASSTNSDRASTDETSIDLSHDETSNNTSVSLPLTVPTLPSLRQYIQFALPCLALWIAGPLLSLVDTSFIGLSSKGGNSARQLAALGPATTL
jgi:hypothetical protein